MALAQVTGNGKFLTLKKDMALPTETYLVFFNNDSAAIGACIKMRAPSWLLESLLQTEGEPRRFLSEFNDTHTHADVMALFDRAIALAKASS